MMRQKHLLIDVGNSTLKYCFEDQLEAMSLTVLRHGEYDLMKLMSQLHLKFLLSKISLASVYQKEIAELIQQWCHVNDVFFLQAKSELKFEALQNAYRIPEQLGVDRWLAMVALHQQQAGAFSVISCGTAITLDCVDADKKHLGGVIMPGLEMMGKMLVEHTEAISGVGPFIGLIKPLGKNTPEAVQSGLLFSIVGMIQLVLQEQKMDGCPIYITGGNAEMIAKNLRLCVNIMPTLVLNGLLVFSQRNITA